MGNEVGRAIQAGSTQMEVTGPYLNNRKVIRSAKNPLDKCTIVSIFPKQIDEYKCTIEPGRFFVGAGTFEHPAILVVGGSSWWREIDVDQPMLEIPVSSIQVAESVVKDYCNGLLACDMVDLMPGIFYVHGAATAFEIREKYKGKLAEMKAKQDNWYKKLVQMADSLWARANRNPLAISDEMRLAANSLNLMDKEWLQDAKFIEMVKCFACGQLKDPAYPVCPACRAIDTNNPQAKDLKFAVA